MFRFWTSLYQYWSTGPSKKFPGERASAFAPKDQPRGPSNVMGVRRLFLNIYYQIAW